MNDSEILSFEKNNKIYQKIYKSSLKLLYPYTPEKTYATIVHEAMQLVGAKHGSLFLFPNNEIKRVYSSINYFENIVPRPKGYTWNVYKTQKPYMLHISKIKHLHPEISKLKIGSDIGIPIAYNDKVFGVLSVMSAENVIFSEKELLILSLFSPLASLALRNLDLYTDVKNSLQEQDLFISMAAHELKTPLTSILIYSQLLLKDTFSDTKQTSQFKIKMYHEIQRLSKLVNELLQMSQIKKGRLQYEMKKCDLFKIIDYTTANFQNADKNHAIGIKIKDNLIHAYIKADHDKMVQVFTNLLTNAAKFSNTDSPIDLTLSKKDHYYILTIQDHGIGIERKDMERIFEGFYKVSSAKKEGLGLGLFLVKSIIEKHNGEIDVKSQLGKGTTFIISLPQYNPNG